MRAGRMRPLVGAVTRRTGGYALGWVAGTKDLGRGMPMPEAERPNGQLFPGRVRGVVPWLAACGVVGEAYGGRGSYHQAGP